MARTRKARPTIRACCGPVSRAFWSGEFRAVDYFQHNEKAIRATKRGHVRVTVGTSAPIDAPEESYVVRPLDMVLHDIAASLFMGGREVVTEAYVLRELGYANTRQATCLEAVRQVREGFERMGSAWICIDTGGERRNARKAHAEVLGTDGPVPLMGATMTRRGAEGFELRLPEGAAVEDAFPLMADNVARGTVQTVPAGLFEFGRGTRPSLTARLVFFLLASLMLQRSLNVRSLKYPDMVRIARLDVDGASDETVRSRRRRLTSELEAMGADTRRRGDAAADDALRRCDGMAKAGTLGGRALERAVREAEALRITRGLERVNDGAGRDAGVVLTPSPSWENDTRGAGKRKNAQRATRKMRAKNDR